MNKMNSKMLVILMLHISEINDLLMLHSNSSSIDNKSSIWNKAKTMNMLKMVKVMIKLSPSRSQKNRC